MYVAQTNGNIRGFAVLGYSRDPDAAESVGELFGLYVAPQSWRTGLGSLLHGQVLDALKELGCRSATLWVLESNDRARTFYENRGWEHDGLDKDLEENGVTLHATRYRRPSLTT
jgi:GNAT superfamily N-acetyltransferase